MRDTDADVNAGAILAQPIPASASGAGAFGRPSASLARFRHKLPVVAAAVVSLFGVVAAFGTVQQAPEAPVNQTLAVEALPVTLGAPLGDEGDYYSEERFQRGDTFASLLDRLGVADDDRDALRHDASALRTLRPGTQVRARIAPDGTLKTLSFLSGRERLSVVERGPGGFTLREGAAPLSRREVMRSAQIRSSLFAATDAADIPDSIAVQLADIFAGDIDFTRDLRLGDRISVVYEDFFHEGREVRPGRLLAAELVNQSRTLRAVWYAEGEGDARIAGYYTPEGKSLRKAFLRSPLEFSRISSGFGLRMHPIQQRWRQHTGIDFAAPEGTRVKATADGVVEFAGQQAGYGNLIELRHSSGYSTWYAHLSGFTRGLHKGMRIAQGEVIGFVGQTGWATGPHLHYEFRVNNQFRNPLAMAFPSALPLPADKRQAFAAQARPLVAQLDMLRQSNLALLD